MKDDTKGREISIDVFSIKKFKMIKNGVVSGDIFEIGLELSRKEANGKQWLVLCGEDQQLGRLLKMLKQSPNHFPLQTKDANQWEF